MLSQHQRYQEMLKSEGIEEEVTLCGECLMPETICKGPEIHYCSDCQTVEGKTITLWVYEDGRILDDEDNAWEEDGFGYKEKQ